MQLPLILLLAPAFLGLDQLPAAKAEPIAADHVRLTAVYPEGNMIGATIKLLEGAERFCRGKGKAVSVSPMVPAEVPKSDRATRRLGDRTLTEEYRCVPEAAEPAKAP